MTKYALLPVCLMLAAFANAANAAAETESTGPIAAVQAYDDAWNRKDREALGNLIAPDFAYFSSKGAHWSRDLFLGRLLSSDYALESSDRSELVEHRTGDTAVVSSRWRGHGSYEGTQFVDDQRCSLVLALVGKEWKVASEHCTQIVAE